MREGVRKEGTGREEGDGESRVGGGEGRSWEGAGMLSCHRLLHEAPLAQEELLCCFVLPQVFGGLSLTNHWLIVGEGASVPFLGRACLDDRDFTPGGSGRNSDWKWAVGDFLRPETCGRTFTV